MNYFEWGGIMTPMDTFEIKVHHAHLDHASTAIYHMAILFQTKP